MTVEQIKENGTLIEIENPELIPVYREYWQIGNIVYIIDENNEIEDSYEKA